MSLSAMQSGPTLAAPPVRGARWVLQWATAVAVVAWFAMWLLAFGYQLAAEQRLACAAAAGVREAGLPSATSHSVGETVRRRLGPQDQVSLTVLRNAQPVLGLVRPVTGDRLTVRLSLPRRSVLPAWLRAVTPSHSSPAVRVRADHRFAGR